MSADALETADRPDLIRRLTARIRAIEGRRELLEPPSSGGAAACEAPQDGGWWLGMPEIDRRLGPRGLEGSALHEIKPACFGDRDAQASEGWAGTATAALAFGLMLAKRRLLQCSLAGTAPAPILWCWPAVLARELGGLYAPGLSALGLEAADLLVVEPGKAADVLWAMEEGLRSGAPALVVGVLPDIGLTPARRLALAAAAGGTPCLAVTDLRTPVAGATSTRWRIGRAASAAHPLAAWLDDVLPGAPRYRVWLERCRAAGGCPSASPLILEWSDASHRFRLVSPSADRAPAQGRAGRHSSGRGG